MEPANNQMYEHLFVVQDFMIVLLSMQFTRIEKSMKSVWQWISADGLLGSSDREGIGMIETRLLRKQYQKYVKEQASVATIGYARKFYGKEPVDERVRLLQKQIDHLRDSCLAIKVYVSTNCNSSMPIERRDKKPDQQTRDKLANCAGSMIDLLHRLKTNKKPIRIVVIDYAGLSTDFGDIHAFITKYEQIVEIVIDIDYPFEILPRNLILSDNEISKKFNCRIGPKKRSRTIKDD